MLFVPPKGADRANLQQWTLMHPMPEFRRQPPEFWALVKLVSQVLGYSERGTGRIKRYDVRDVDAALRKVHLKPCRDDHRLERVVAYVAARADLLEGVAAPNLMNREEAADLFDEIRARVDPPDHLLAMNKQKKEKRHYAYLTCIVNMLTHEKLTERFGEAMFDHNPRIPLTFARDGMPLRTLFRWMDGAYPDARHPHSAWEIKEYYGTTTFGSRVADGVYETALDGYELNDLRSEGVEVEHYLFLDDRYTWWDCGRSYLCRIVDMLHADLLDGAFFGREVVDGWPPIVAGWPAASPTQK